jgi:L-fuconolactonase
MAVRVDAHHHFWDTESGKFDYYWMTGPLHIIRGKRTPEDLRPWLNAKGIDKTVIVQTIPSVAETRDFMATAAEVDFVGGVVGWVDLTDASVADTLSELKQRKDAKYLVGIRHQVHDEEDANWLLRQDVRNGLTAVGEADLVYDLLLRPRELPAGIETVRTFPEMRFVVDHIAKPNIKAGEIEPWASGMKELSAFENVWVKVSGMITEADWYNWKPEDLKPYVQRLLDWFGPKRLLFGSDWPVCTLAGTYSQVYDAAAYALGALSKEGQDAVFGENAAKVYRLDV